MTAVLLVTLTIIWSISQLCFQVQCWSKHICPRTKRSYSKFYCDANKDSCAPSVDSEAFKYSCSPSVDSDSFIANHDYERKSSLNNSGLGTEELLYVDQDILVFNKPANCQTAPGYLTAESLALTAQKTFNIERVDHMIVHRLDYATSGIIIFARNVEALKDLHTQFRLNQVHKRYRALVSGTFSTFEGEVDLPLRKNILSKPLQEIHPLGKPSKTEWKVSAMDESNTLLVLTPLTGRTHQLRLHMKAIGHPIVGDFFYATKEVYLQSDTLCLHAEEIRFFHPTTKKAMFFCVPAPFSLHG